MAEVMVVGLVFGGMAYLHNKCSPKEAFCPSCLVQCEVYGPTGRFRRAKRGKPCYCVGCNNIFKYNGNHENLTT